MWDCSNHSSVWRRIQILIKRIKLYIKEHFKHSCACLYGNVIEIKITLKCIRNSEFISNSKLFTAIANWQRRNHWYLKFKGFTFPKQRVSSFTVVKKAKYEISAAELNLFLKSLYCSHDRILFLSLADSFVLCLPSLLIPSLTNLISEY